MRRANFNQIVITFSVVQIIIITNNCFRVLVYCFYGNSINFNKNSIMYTHNSGVILRSTVVVTKFELLNTQNSWKILFSVSLCTMTHHNLLMVAYMRWALKLFSFCCFCFHLWQMDEVTITLVMKHNLCILIFWGHKMIDKNCTRCTVSNDLYMH